MSKILATKSAARLSYETDALMNKMVRTRQMRLDGKTSTPAYAKAIESIRKTKALCHKIRGSMFNRAISASNRATAAAVKSLTSPPKPAPSVEEMVGHVQAHAHTNYSKGWDFIVECYTTAELAETLKASKVRSLSGALKLFADVVKHNSDVALDHSLEAVSSVG